MSSPEFEPWGCLNRKLSQWSWSCYIYAEKSGEIAEKYTWNKHVEYKNVAFDYLELRPDIGRFHEIASGESWLNNKTIIVEKGQLDEIFISSILAPQKEMILPPTL